MDNNQLRMALSCMKVALGKQSPTKKVNFNKGTNKQLSLTYGEALTELELLMNYLETQNRFGTCNQCLYFKIGKKYPHFGKCQLTDDECHEYDSCDKHDLLYRRK